MHHNQINNLKALEDKRKQLRNNLTPAEATLWTMLKGKQLDGRKFRRQHSVEHCILDFYCPAEKLAIELDGEGHFQEAQISYDAVRTRYLDDFGIRVVRFENGQVFQSPEGVLAEIRKYFDHPCSANGRTSPPWEGEE
jgi:very-short-patch-repair endonuclease